MEIVPLEIIADMQAQIDEMQARLLETLTRQDDIATAAWEVATCLEYLTEDTARDGHVKTRILERLSSAIETFEQVMGVCDE